MVDFVDFPGLEGPVGHGKEDPGGHLGCEAAKGSSEGATASHAEPRDLEADFSVGRE